MRRAKMRIHPQCFLPAWYGQSTCARQLLDYMRAPQHEKNKHPLIGSLCMACEKIPFLNSLHEREVKKARNVLDRKTFGHAFGTGRQKAFKVLIPWRRDIVRHDLEGLPLQKYASVLVVTIEHDGKGRVYIRFANNDNYLHRYMPDLLDDPQWKSPSKPTSLGEPPGGLGPRQEIIRGLVALCSGAARAELYDDINLEYTDDEKEHLEYWGTRDMAQRRIQETRRLLRKREELVRKFVSISQTGEVSVTKYAWPALATAMCTLMPNPQKIDEASRHYPYGCYLEKNWVAPKWVTAPFQYAPSGPHEVAFRGLVAVMNLQSSEHIKVTMMGPVKEPVISHHALECVLQELQKLHVPMCGVNRPQPWMGDRAEEWCDHYADWVSWPEQLSDVSLVHARAIQRHGFEYHGESQGEFGRFPLCYRNHSDQQRYEAYQAWRKEKSPK